MTAKPKPDGTAIFDLDGLSDEDLRAYELDIEHPELIPNYSKSKPVSDKFIQAIKGYAIPHQKHSREHMAWCCYCQEHNHYDGGLALFESGVVRSVGWKCGGIHLGVQFKRAHEAYQRKRTRKEYLLQRDRLREVLPSLHEEVARARRLPAVDQVRAIRRQMEEHMAGLYKELAGAAVHNDGYLSWEERIADYSRVEQVREGDHEHGDRADQKLAGLRTRVVPRRRRVAGYLFLDGRNDPGSLLADLERELTVLVDVYAATDTNAISNEKFRSYERKLKHVLKEIKRVEAVLHSPRAFFTRSNLAFVVGYYAQKRPALIRRYSASNRTLLLGDNGEVISLALPDDYTPYVFTTVQRVEGALWFGQR